jgi:TRAP-type C4-dicarboxylate transport system substrate-binding protein
MLDMSRRFRGTLAFASLLASSMWSATSWAADYSLRWSDIGPPRGPRAEAMKWWAEELKKRSNGRIEIEFFWGQSLVKAKDNLKALGSGLVETAQLIASYTPAELSVWNYASVPFGIDNEWVGMRAWFDMHQTSAELQKEAERNKFKLLFNNTTGPVHLLTTKEPITSVEQLKGKKIRTTGGHTNLFKALGAVPVTIGFGELYQALERGTIDGTINYTPFVKSYKHYEVASHLTEASMGQYLAYGGGINLKLFNEMPTDLQDILLKVSNEYMDVYARLQIEDTEKSRKELIAGIDGRKVQFHALPEAERARWAKAAEDFTVEWTARMAKSGIDAKDFIGRLNGIAGKYQATLKSDGYPWAKKTN